MVSFVRFNDCFGALCPTASGSEHQLASPRAMAAIRPRPSRDDRFECPTFVLLSTRHEFDDASVCVRNTWHYERSASCAESLRLEPVLVLDPERGVPKAQWPH